jgi:hypothetical protein
VFALHEIADGDGDRRCPGFKRNVFTGHANELVPAKNSTGPASPRLANTSALKTKLAGAAKISPSRGEIISTKGIGGHSTQYDKTAESDSLAAPKLSVATAFRIHGFPKSRPSTPYQRALNGAFVTVATTFVPMKN